MDKSAQHSSQTFGVRVEPAELRFNAAHFITFNDSCENLHGHNFHVRVELTGTNTADAFVVDFVWLSQVAAEICAGLHDRILLPGHSAEVHLEVRDDQIEVRCHGRYFSLPARNCVVLPLPNTTAEMLAAYLCDRLAGELARAGAIHGLHELEVAVEEADRQWGICRRPLDRQG